MHVRRRRRPRQQAGFTLIELMISLVLFSFAIAGVLAVAVSMANGFREQRAVVGTEGAARAALNFVADAIRGTSPGVASGAITVIDESACSTGALAVTNDNVGPDEVTVVFAYGSVTTQSTTLYDTTATSLTVHDASDLASGDMILITDFATGVLVKIDSVAGTTLTLRSQLCTHSGYLAGATVIRAARARFYIAALDGIPTLWMDPDAEDPTLAGEPLAEGVEDLQIAVGTDVDGGGVTENGAAGNDDDWHYNHASDTVVNNAAWPPIRAVRVSLVARGTTSATGVASFTKPDVEDHASTGALDQYRRRVLSSIVEIRNLGGSP